MIGRIYKIYVKFEDIERKEFDKNKGVIVIEATYKPRGKYKGFPSFQINHKEKIKSISHLDNSSTKAVENTLDEIREAKLLNFINKNITTLSKLYSHLNQKRASLKKTGIEIIKGGGF